MRYYHPLVLFLDEDLAVSARSFTDNLLELNIKHTTQVLMCGFYYFIGIRNKKMHAYYFSKEHKGDTLDKWFHGYPYKKSPSFVSYNSVESRWVRKCEDHFSYLVDYLRCMMEEHEFRMGKEHELYDLYDFFSTCIYFLGVKNGIRIPSAHLKKIDLPWKNLPPRYRKKDIIAGYRLYYASFIGDPFTEYNNVPRDIPSWLI